MSAKQLINPVMTAAETTGITDRTRDPLLISIPQAAALISSTPKAIRTLIRTGRLPYISNIGKKFLISPSDIVRLIEKSKVGGAK